jgi:hypothetical protein
MSEVLGMAHHFIDVLILFVKPFFKRLFLLPEPSGLAG